MANFNSPQQAVISGRPLEVQGILAQCESLGISGRLLPVSCAFHSPLVKPSQEAFAHFLTTMTIEPAKIPVYSNTTACPHLSEGREITQQLIEHLTNPVRFRQEIEAMYEAGGRIFIEVGPRAILTQLVDQILHDKSHVSVALDQPGRSGILQLMKGLGQLFTQGLPLTLDRLYRSHLEKAGDWLYAKDQQNTGPSQTIWMVRGDRARPLKPSLAQPGSAQKKSSPKKPEGDERCQKELPKAQVLTEAPGGNGSKLQQQVNLQGIKQREAQDSRQWEDKQGRDKMSGAAGGEKKTLVSGLGASDGPDEMMDLYHKMMRKFLDTQKELMLRYIGMGAAPVGYRTQDQPSTRHASGSPRDLGGPSILGGPSPHVSQVQGEKAKSSNHHAPGSPVDLSGPSPQAMQAQGERAKSPKEEKESIGSLSLKLTKENIQELLLEIVSERTGYPPEMLGLNLDMEADLGIDSIKRVEILQSFQRKLTHTFQDSSFEMDMEKLNGIKTLQGIIEMVAQLAEMKDEDIQRFVLGKVEAKVSRNQIALSKGRVVLITEDERGLARLFASRLKEKGYQCVLIRREEKGEEIEPGVYTADIGDYENVADMLGRIRREHGPFGALIHLYPFRSDEKIEKMSLFEWKRLLKQKVKGLYYLARLLGPELKEAAVSGGGLLMAVTSMGGSFGSFHRDEETPLSPGQGGCAGLVKSLRYEWPEVNLKVVDLHPGEETEELVQYLLDEMGEGMEEVEVGYRQGRRMILKPIVSPVIKESKPRLQIDSSWVFLLTGGARGITAETAKELSRRYQPTLLLVGSSPLPKEKITFDLTGSLKEVKARLAEQMKKEGKEIGPSQLEREYQQLVKAKEIRENLEELQHLGAQVHYYQTDVRDEESFTRLIDEIYQKYGKIDGVIHGAGIIEDKLIKDKLPASFDRVFDTKADSAFMLSQKLHFDSLKLLVFFSSVAGRFGNRGQADYAAANEVLNKLALYLDKQWPARVVSINWGPWANSNMVSSLLEKEFARRGVHVISRAEGPLWLAEEICYGRKGEVEVIWGQGGWEILSPKEERKEEIPQTIRRTFPLFGSGASLTRNEQGGFEFFYVVDPARDIYILDHQLDGKPVLPMTMALELMAEVVSMAWPEWNIRRIKTLKVLKGLVVSKPITICIVADPLPSGSSEILQVRVEIKDEYKSKRSHYSTLIEMGKEANGQLDWQPPELTEAKLFPMSVQGAYQQWLFHGPLFQGIREIHKIGTNGIHGIFTPSFPQKLLAHKPFGEWLIDPVVIDSGLQMIILWSKTYWDMMPLPSGFQQFRRFGPLSGSKIGFEGRILPQSTPGMLHADLAFFNEEGKLAALLEDMEAACSKSLNRLAGKEKR